MSRIRRACLAALIVVCINWGIRTIVRSIGNVPESFDPFTWPPIVCATLGAIAAATGVYFGMRKFLGKRTDRIFTVVAAVLLVVSSITPVTLLWSVPPQYPGTSMLTVIALEVMHVITALGIVAALTKSPRKRPTAVFATPSC